NSNSIFTDSQIIILYLNFGTIVLKYRIERCIRMNRPKIIVKSVAYLYSDTIYKCNIYRSVLGLNRNRVFCCINLYKITDKGIGILGCGRNGTDETESSE